VHERAVVALHEVLGDDLPVRLELVRHAPPPHEPVDVDLRHVARQVEERREQVDERRGVAVDAREQQRSDSGDRELGQPTVIRIDLGPRRAVERAVQQVRPSVIAALKRLAPAAAVRDDMSPVPADVRERAQPSFAVTRDDDRQAPEVGCHERSRLRDIRSGADVVPVRRKHGGPLPREELRIGEPDRRGGGHGAGHRTSFPSVITARWHISVVAVAPCA
jgi:hypothetical protein